MLTMDPTPLEAQITLGGEGYVPFMRMLPDGGEGAFFKEIEDYFFYAQIKRYVWGGTRWSMES